MRRSLKAWSTRLSQFVTTVGPYLLYGTNWCGVRGVGTDYFDLCGETPWMRRTSMRNQTTAERSGARITVFLRYDSLPFELGVFLRAGSRQESVSGTTSRVKGRIRAMKGTFSGERAASGKALLRLRQRIRLFGIVARSVRADTGLSGAKQPPATGRSDEDLQVWLTPFFMANINTRNVHRSNMLLAFLYGRDFVYDEMQITAPARRARRWPGASRPATTDGDVSRPEAGRGAVERERENGSTICCSSPSRLMAGRPARRSRATRSRLRLDSK